jgi:DNA-directed RNA polymerase specialized sigma subunit
MSNQDDGRRRRERELWRRWGRERDPRAREALVALYMPMARRTARRYAGVAEPYDVESTI